MKRKITTVALLTLVFALVLQCGKVSGGEDEKKDSKATGIISPDDPAASATGSPPAYVSQQTISSTQLEITLTKECTDATGLNTANFLLSNGLQVVSITKKSGQPNTLVLNTTIQQAISYTLTMLNLTSTEGASLVGVLQVTFTGLPSPAITSIDWRNPADGTALPGNLGTISLCTLSTGSGASCTNAPFYTKNGLYGIVTGAYAVSYSYKIDAGSWSAEIPIATPLTVSGLAEGYHTIYVIGKHANGYWQATTASDVYTKSYVQDTVAPNAYIDPLTFPASVTASLSFNVRVIGTDVSYFRYCLDNGAINDCTTNTWRGGPDIASLGYAVPNAATVYTGNLVPGAVTIKVIGYDASGNALAAPISGGTYSYIVDTGTVEAVFNASDIAAITTTGTSASVRITNTNGAVAYRGKIISGTDCNSGTAWNALPELPLATPITATGLSGDGTYVTVCAIGKSLAGNWQGGWTTASATASIVTKYTWTIDTTAPTAALNWITPVSQPTTTTQTNYELQVSTSGGVTHYKYALATGTGAACSSASYGAETPVSTSIQLSPLSTPAIATTGVTVYKVCVVARDAAGNYQPVASATATPEWTVDVDPPASNPSFASASQSPRSFNIAVMQFDIDNSTATSDTEYYRIKVAKDVAFTQIVSDVYVKSCKNISLPECPAALGTKTYSIAVDAYTSGSVYACVLAGDSYGNYRTDSCVTPPAQVYVSAEHYVVGKITGTVKNTAGSTLSGISVRMYDSDGTPLNTQYADQVTNAAGVFTFSNVHTARNRYRVAAAFSDATYRPAAKRSISVQEVGSGGTVASNIGTLNLVPLAATTLQNIVAKVVDADDGWMLGYANVKLVDWQGNTVGSAQRTVYTSNAAYADCDSTAPVGAPPTNIPKNISSGGGICGDFAFSGVSPGTYSIEVTGNSWASGNQTYNDLRQENVVVPDTTESKILIIRAGGTTGSQVYEPVNNKLRPGPTVTGTPNNGAHAFFVNSGPFAGKYILVRGGNNTTRVFNPIDNSTSLAGPNLAASSGAGANSFAITSGPQSGKTLVVHGGAVNTTSLYDPAAHSFAAGPALTGLAGAGSHSFAITTGVQAGKVMVVHGNGLTTTSLYDPATNTFAAGPALPAVANTGAFGTAVTSGIHAGKAMSVLGGGGSNTALYDPSLNTFAAGPALSSNAGAGALAFAITSGSNSGKALVIHGNASNTTSLFDPATGLFAAGAGLTANAGAGANSFAIGSGSQSGKQFVVLGNSSTATALFDPSTSTFSAGTALGGNVGAGGYNIVISAVSAGRLPLVRSLTGQDLKVVLSWGSGDPLDLDLHTVGTLPSGQTLTNVNGDDCGTGNNSLFHVWAARPNVGLTWAQQYSAKTRTYIQGDASYNGSNYFPTSPDTTTALVQDTITGFGPEAINFISGYTDGTYWFSVVNWSQWFPGSYTGADKQNQQWDVTNVEIKVYDADGLAFQMAAGAPSGSPDFAQSAAAAGCSSATDWQQCELWRAFKMTVSGSGTAGRTFTPVNGYANWPDASGTQDQGKCNVSGF